VPPFPPDELRRVVADHDLEMFLWTGYLDIQRILALYEQHRDPKSTINPAILDSVAGAVAWSDSSWAPRASRTSTRPTSIQITWNGAARI